MPTAAATAVRVVDGNILFCGYVQTLELDADNRPIRSDLILGRLTSTGELDTTFGELVEITISMTGSAGCPGWALP